MASPSHATVTRPVRLGPEHVVEYRALMLEAYDLHPDAFTSSLADRAPLPLMWWERRLAGGEDASNVVFGAFVDDVLAGVAGLAFDTREKVRHKATLFGMYVPERHGRQGLGRSLVHAALDMARTHPGTLLVQLTVTEGNVPAQRLYESCGFVAFGVEPMAIRAGRGFVSKVHMWRDLGSPPQVYPAA
jgi:RimJ/RimL family protein N-acetyltransferase